MLYVQKSKRNLVISGQMSMIQQLGEEVTKEMKMNEILQELRAIKLNQELEIQGKIEIQGEAENKLRTCPKIL